MLTAQKKKIYEKENRDRGPRGYKINSSAMDCHQLAMIIQKWMSSFMPPIMSADRAKNIS